MMLMWSVSSYDDGTGFCTGIQNNARCNPTPLPVPDPMETQGAIYWFFHTYAFDAAHVCYHLVITDGVGEDAIQLDFYCYFTCILPHCYDCYDKAFKWLMERDGSGCPGAKGAYISLDDGCCLRYELDSNFCGARN
ncbi:hypothetical protein LINGRAHAP2_LOCUS26153 [Linum grandiflorum]